MNTASHIPLPDFPRRSPEVLLRRAEDFRHMLATRRTVRDFASDAVPRAVIESCLRVAGGAPSGANQQPWHFAVIESPEIKSKIRAAAEEEERTFYTERAPQAWLDALAPLGTDAHKPFLEIAPYLIVCFGQRYGFDAQGERVKHYYVPESLGIAMGFLIAALHHAGLATLTHTPSPMKFLTEICGRPEHEQPYVLLVVGLPSAGATVPNITKKPLAEISSWI